VHAFRPQRPALRVSGAAADEGVRDYISASITIRNLEESTKRKLKIRTATNGRSMEQEAPETLRARCDQRRRNKEILQSAFVRFGEPLGGIEELPAREPSAIPNGFKIGSR